MMPQGGWTALMKAAQEGNVNCVRALLAAGANKNTKKDVSRDAHMTP